VIEYHADDFGLFLAQSQEILDCYRNGCLNGISIMPNSPYLKECMDLLDKNNNIKIAIHLNFMEGKCLSSPSKVSLLVDEKGTFSSSFGKLLFHSFLPGKARYRKQLKEEIFLQIKTASSYLKNRPLRIDGHAHYHMIPIIFDTLIEVLREENMEVEYIRIPCENLKLYLHNYKNLDKISCVNIVKVITLNILAARNLWKHRKYLSSMRNQLFIGVMFSGNMNLKNVQMLLSDAIKISSKGKYGIEILAHPGGVYKETDIAQLTHPDDIKFLTSKQRKKEKEMFYLMQRKI